MTEGTAKKDYKATLNLPRTEFPMKAGLPRKEPEILDSWEKMALYDKIMAERSGSSEKFILHDGPPYANGHLHVGHVLNKILKDICIKYRSMKGAFSPFVPGWDCHGLPVEHQLLKELKISKHEIDIVEFRKKAYDYAMRFVEIQAEEFKRLGVLGDWEDPYLTLSEQYESSILYSLADLYEKGYIYRDIKPVNWCYSCETALAEAEVEYADKTSNSVYVKFDAGVDIDGKKAFFIIWTTTPWTLPANTAVAIHPDVDYSYVNTGKEIWIMAGRLVEDVMQKTGAGEYSIVSTKKGDCLASEIPVCRHPFEDRDSRIVLAGHVTVEEGTGCVHTAPGHGQDDHYTGKKYGLPVIMPVDDKGIFNSEAAEFKGMHVNKADNAIIEKMTSNGTLIFTEKIEHSYPHCWRCKSPVIFRATKQWFLKVDHEGLREKIMEMAAKDIEWVPASGKDRISAMIEGRPDWCLSRQRYWGVPIPAFSCVECGRSFTDPAIIRYTAGLTEKSGSNVWFEKSVPELAPPGTSCPECGGSRLNKENDILDVWFDSGVSHEAVLKKRDRLSFPADMYLEGSDQHRGWFQSAVITSAAMNGCAPYNKVLTHGFVVDGEGRKMSKSAGNVVSPGKVMEKYGADILRLWVASSDYETDIKVSSEILERLADGYRKIRNTFRFLLSNLYDYDHSVNGVTYEQTAEADKWMLSRLSDLVETADENYRKSEFHKVYRKIYDFCVYEVSALYMDFMKDRLYVLAADSPERRSHQTVIFNIFSVITRIMAPILSFTTEEAWSYFGFKGKKESVHLELWPGILDGHGGLIARKDPDIEKKWNGLLSMRDTVMKLLEDERGRGLIGSSLDASVSICPKNETEKELLAANKDILTLIFKVSEVIVLQEDTSSGETGFAVKKAPGKKCPRCWNYSDAIDEKKPGHEICVRCRDAVSFRSKE